MSSARDSGFCTASTTVGDDLMGPTDLNGNPMLSSTCVDEVLQSLLQQQQAPQQQLPQQSSSTDTPPTFQRQSNVMPQPLDLSVDVSRFWTLFKPMYAHIYLVCRTCNDEMYKDSQKLAYDGERTRFTHTLCRVCTKINIMIRELYIQNIAPK
ncbi:hypothetical protein AAVH_31817, partial [Aphelenchoides avenae]